MVKDDGYEGFTVFPCCGPGRHDNRGSDKAVHGPAAAEQADEGAGGRIRDNPVYQGKRHIRLTEEGIFLGQQAEEILSLMEKTRGQLSRMGTRAGGLISIGVTESCGAGVLSDIIEISQRFSRNPV